MKKIVILGSTGSIGLNALQVVSSLPGELSVEGLAVNSDYEGVLAQAARYGVKNVGVSDPAAAEKCGKDAPSCIKVFGGDEGIEELAALDGIDMVLCAVVGMAGLKPVLAAVEKGIDVALATKEVLVAGGAVVTKACSESGARLIPVDSEHGAILQCIEGSQGTVDSGQWTVEKIKRLVLTASGGPFFMAPEIDFEKVTVDQALEHPNWDMGKKVTVDSATMMNKGLEIIEAHWIFGVPVENIDVVVHPESIVHSMVEFVDGSTLAQMSVPDMRYAIQYALTYPERMDGGLHGLKVSEISELRFMNVDDERFPAVRIAREAAEQGGTMPAVMNAANEAAVQMFLDERISFRGIWQTVEKVMGEHDVVAEAGLEAVLEADVWARGAAVEKGV